jgi:hypothetical protein
MIARPRHPIPRSAAPDSLLLSLACIVLSACTSTTPSLTLSVTPATVQGDGQKPVTLSAKVMQGDLPAESATVHFELRSKPENLPVGTLAAAQGGGGLAATVLDVPASSGVAEATLTVPRRGRGTIEVTATASVDGIALTQTASIALAPAGRLANTLTFDCPVRNVGALISPRQEIQIVCAAKAKDAAGEILNASIEGFVEAGAGKLAWETDDLGHQQLVYTIATTDPGPRDVTPLGSDGLELRGPCSGDALSSGWQGEPCWTDGSGKIHNPRDGLATLLVAVPAVPGIFDAGQSYGEPFVDEDDNGKRSPDETFIDVNGDGQYNAADSGSGTTQPKRMLWKSVRIVWSGKVSTAHGAAITGQRSGLALANGQLLLHDQNYNKLASLGDGDFVQLNGGSPVACAAPVDAPVNFTFTPSSQFPLEPTQAIVPDADLSGIKLADGNEAHPISQPGSASAYYATRLPLPYPLHGHLDVSPSSTSVCSFQATITRAYDPAGSQLSAPETVSGDVRC